MTESRFVRKVDILDRLTSIAERLEYKVVREPLIGGLQPDMVVQTPDGRTIVVEVKNGGASEAVLQAASFQVEAYKRAADAEAAVIVIPDASSQLVSRGLLDERSFEAYLNRFVSSGQTTFRSGRRVKGHGAPEVLGVHAHLDQTKAGVPYVFAALPFKEEFEDTLLAMGEAAASVGAYCKSSSEMAGEADIPREIEILLTV